MFINRAVLRGGTLLCPGGLKSHITEIKPMSLICFDSQCRDLELLKRCAALSECRKCRVIIWASKSGVPCSPHGMSPKVTYRIRDKMAHAIAAQSMTVNIDLPKTNRTGVYLSCFLSTLTPTWHCLTKTRWRNKLRWAHPCLPAASSTMYMSSDLPRRALFSRQSWPKKHQGPAPSLLPHLPQ